MAHRTCVRCKQPGRFLQAPSEGASVEYYRCDSCGTVWTHETNAPDDDSAREITHQQQTAEPRKVDRS